MSDLFKHLKNDLPASIIVFFVALPLCLGIAMASGAPLFAGIIAGIVGGVVVGSLSGSPLGVSGPAAGLAVIVMDAIVSLGSWEVFLLAVVFAGVLQILMGYLKLGIIGYYFPTSVIKGMLAGIGLVIIIKQIPQAIGYVSEVSSTLALRDGKSSLTAFEQLLASVNPAAVLTSVLALGVLILWESYLQNKHKIFRIIQGPLVVILLGIGLNLLLPVFTSLSFVDRQLVQIPISDGLSGFIGNLTFPSFSADMLLSKDLYIVALVIAVVASLETLLCVEATDKLDPYKRITPTNRELKAQGVGNMFSGLVGGLPITQVIVRSSANISFGGRTKLSAIMHGFFILIFVIAAPEILNLIPLSALAAILFVVGYKLATPQLFKRMYAQGLNQFLPFIITVAGILLTDLLTGIAIGMAVGIFSILRNNYLNPYSFATTEEASAKHYTLKLSEEVTFLNKGSILKYLKTIPDGAKLIIDAQQSRYIDFDVKEIIRDFSVNAKEREIEVEVLGLESEV